MRVWILLGGIPWLCAASADPILACETNVRPDCVQLVRASGELLLSERKAKRVPVPKAKDDPAEFKERIPYTEEQQRAAVVPGFPDARFWGDSVQDFLRALPAEPGPWLILSSGGAAGAFGAGLIVGLTESGKRPAYTVVTGVSTGALIGVYAFLGPRYDDRLLDNFTRITPADIFTDSVAPESLLDTWPLKKSIAKRVDAKLLADVAAEHRNGRRLFVTTANLDAGRPVVWDLGAIAVRGGEAGLKLFRDVLLAATAIEGVFPPVMIDVEANGKRYQEMHADGGVFGPLFVSPADLLIKPDAPALPATELHLVVNSKLDPEFEVTERDKLAIISRMITLAIKYGAKAEIALVGALASRAKIGVGVAVVDPDFHHPVGAMFDEKYMKALWDLGLERGKSGKAFVTPPGAPPLNR